MAAAAAWSYANYAESYAVVSGRVELTNPVIAVGAPAPGKVVAIDVSDGQSVIKGEIVAELESADALSARAHLIAKVIDAKAEIQRFQAVLDAVRPATPVLPASIAWDKATPRDIAVRQSQLFRSEISQIGEALDRIAAKREEASLRRERAAAIITAQRAYIDTLTEVLAMRDQLYKQNADSRIHVLDIQRDIKRAEIDFASAQSNLFEATAEITAADRQRSKLRDGFIAEKQQQISDAASIAADLEAELGVRSKNAELLKILAPAAGTVKGALKSSIGQLVGQSQALLEIETREGARPEVVAYVPQDDGVYLAPAQDAVIEVGSAIPGRRGSILGKITRVVPGSKAGVPAAQSSTSPLGDPFYQILVEPAAASASPLERRPQLEPGMTVSVGIKTDKRRLLDYLLAPISAMSISSKTAPPATASFSHPSEAQPEAKGPEARLAKL